MPLPDEVLKLINNRGHSNGVRYEYSEREQKARCQFCKEPTPVCEVIRLTNDFLKACELEPIENPKKCNFIVNKNGNLTKSKAFYGEIVSAHALKKRSDIVWMKFALSGHLAVIAKGADINFHYPSSKDDYLKRTKNDRNWVYNTSGVILHRLELKWNTNFVLVFPLPCIPDGLKIGDIECGIGNYLIENGVPILDYYSHRY
jgi:hypothetical protein